MIDAVIAVLALLIAGLAWRRAGALSSRLQQVEAAARRAEAETADADARSRRLERYLTFIAAGRPVTAAMIEEGRLFEEIPSAEACRLIEQERPPQLTVLDVRTESEVLGGHVPGALWIPVDQIETRAREVPRDGRVLVVCAAGGRSASACDFLSSRGWTNLTNVLGGMSAYPGSQVSGRP